MEENAPVQAPRPPVQAAGNPKEQLLNSLPRQTSQDGGLFAQLTGNPFFTAVRPIQRCTDSQLMAMYLGLWSSRIRRCSRCRAERCSSWRKSTEKAPTGRCRDQRQGRVIPLVPLLDDHASTSTTLECLSPISHPYWRPNQWSQTRSHGVSHAPLHSRHAPPLHRDREDRTP